MPPKNEPVSDQEGVKIQGEKSLTAREKRKEPPTDSEVSTSKAPKTESSSSEKNIIDFLLSPAGLELCQNATAEPKFKSGSKSSLRDYFSPDLTPVRAPLS